MAESKWMIYGAYGFTGELITEEAVRQGRNVLLAGRSREKLQPLAERLGLEYTVFSLEDAVALSGTLKSVDLVINAAGLFVNTAGPMVDACLNAGVHYLDIAGEIASFQIVYERHEKALQRGIALLPGAGFDVVPTDCLARYVFEQLPDATTLELASQAVTSPTGGTMKSVLEGVSLGGRVRRNGNLVEYPLGKGAQQVCFPGGCVTVTPIPAPELLSAHRTTGIQNITVSTHLPGIPVPLLKLFGPLLQGLVSITSVRKGLGTVMSSFIQGPDEQERTDGRSYIWARAINDDGAEKQAWLETIDAYRLTALTALLLAERIQQQQPAGAITPAGSFGADFILEFPGTRRFDSQP